MKRRLSRTHQSIYLTYDVIIVGSGYGGGACAKILAEAGLSVCVLERGREWFPGEFPEKATDLAKSVLGRFNDRGLFELHLNDHVDVVSGNGLGGTSLINAGVMIRPHDKVLSGLDWLGCLPREYFDRALKTLQVNKHPRPPRKGVLFCESFKDHPELTETELVDIAVTFDKNRGGVGVAPEACNDCGNCVSGCNYEAKNTIDVTYLAHAAGAGAHIFTEMGVEYVHKVPGGGFTVCCYDLTNKRYVHVGADRVVVAAGTMGTFKVLAQSKKLGLELSPALGEKFSGNGDILGFGYNGKISKGVRDGPTITSAAYFYDDEDFRDWVTIEEGALPKALYRLLQYSGPILGLFGRKTDNSFSLAAKRIWRRLLDWVGVKSGGALDHSSVYLAVTFEESVGRLYLDDNEVRVDWPGAVNNEFVRDVNAKMQYSTKKDGGIYIRNPRTLRILGKNLVTVHPLGGCPIGDSIETGVVDGRGRIHGCDGLYIADGSIFPTPIGVNPALTITAFAEWIADGIVEEWKDE